MGVMVLLCARAIGDKAKVRKCGQQRRQAIDRELDRVFPVVQDGGYLPHLDHQNDNMSFENYCYYMEKKRKMLRSA